MTEPGSVNDETMTSLPGSRSRAPRAAWMAAVPAETQVTKPTPK